MARLPRRARRLWDRVRTERRTLRQGLVALTLSTLAGFVAGLILSHLTGTLEALPGLLVLIPAAVGMKGTIFGAIGARLGTASAAGVLRPTFERGGILGENVEIGILTTFSSSLWLAVLARMATAAFGEPSLPVWKFALISIVGGLLGTILITAITVAISIMSSRRGWDLDAVATPMVTALGDMTTIPSLFLATLLLRNDAIAIGAAIVSIAVAVVATVRAYMSRNPAIRRVIIEMTGTVLLTPILDVLAGSLLLAREPQLIAVPVLLALVPPFVSQAGALGGIFASRTTSKLQIGVLTPRGLPEAPAVVDAVLVGILSVIVFTLIGVLAAGVGLATGLEGIPPFGVLVGGTVLSGLLLVPVTLSISYGIAVLTYRFGLDPDNQSVPIITSVMDISGVVVVLFVMTSLGVLPHG